MCEAFTHLWCAHRARTAKLLRTRQGLSNDHTIHRPRWGEPSRRAVPAPLAIGNIGTGNISTLATFPIPTPHSPLPNSPLPTPHSPIPHSPLPNSQFPIPNSLPHPFIPPLRSLRSLWLKNIPRARPRSGWRASAAALIRGGGLPCPQIPSGPPRPLAPLAIGNISTLATFPALRRGRRWGEPSRRAARWEGRAPSRPRWGEPSRRAAPPTLGGPRSVAARPCG